MCVDLSDYNRYLNQIWYRTQILKSMTEITNTEINTPEWPNSHKLKIQDGGGRHLGFRKMSITLNLRKSWWADASRPCGDETWPKVETGTFFA